MGGEGGGLSRSHRADEIPNFKGFPSSLPPFESIQFVFGLRLQLAGKRVIRVVRAAYKRAEEAIKVAWRVYRRDLPLFRVVADTSIPGKRARNGTKRIIKATQPLSTTTFQTPVSGTWLGLDIREIIRRNDGHAIKRVFRGRPLPPISRSQRTIPSPLLPLALSIRRPSGSWKD